MDLNEMRKDMPYWHTSGLGFHLQQREDSKKGQCGEFNAVTYIGLYVKNIKTCILDLGIYNLFGDNGNKHILRQPDENTGLYSTKLPNVTS